MKQIIKSTSQHPKISEMHFLFDVSHWQALKFALLDRLHLQVSSSIHSLLPLEPSPDLAHHFCPSLSLSLHPTSLNSPILKALLHIQLSEESPCFSAKLYLLHNSSSNVTNSKHCIINFVTPLKLKARSIFYINFT